MSIPLSSITQTFQGRMNPPEVLPDHWDCNARAQAEAVASSLPPRTIDPTPHKIFSAPFSVDDVNEWKWKKKKVHGLDDIGTEHVVLIPSDILADFFNGSSKSALDPESYCVIGLQSCFLKALMWLIDRCFRDWMEINGILPPSQNGFQEHYRTNNNMFILRAAIDHSRAEGSQLYVAFVDLVNVFPSTDQPTLWAKMTALGAGGPVMDWLHIMY
ncbi:hypothetical protein IW261DRAFT_1336631 [Armillaria novae-zelandiae]|uniref:Reverse transcriptase domain-containing protein n=1 Tax=Armillaria novae-zelandiae TaxID=153914 RepID=A0AA39TCA7_9AGAR|nr:hypothetical protein IW261DRAFT_1336631 [Armillaria novae-zelandiae]